MWIYRFTWALKPAKECFKNVYVNAGDGPDMLD